MSCIAFHPYKEPDDEKRMVVILDDADYDVRLQAPAGESRRFLRQYLATEQVAPVTRERCLELMRRPADENNQRLRRFNAEIC